MNILRIPFFLLFALLVYNFVFPIRLKVLPGSEILLYLVTMSIAIFHFNDLKKFYKLEFFKPLIFFTLALLILAIFSILLNNSDDLLSIVSIVKFVFAIWLSFIFSLISLKKYGEDSFKIIIILFVLSCFLISITCMLEFFFPTFKVIFANLINTSGNIEYNESFRVHGLATGGGASLSVGLAIGSVLSLFLAQKYKSSQSILWALIAFFIFITTILVGRTGFFLLLIFYFSYFSLKLSIKSIFSVLLALFLIFFILGALNDDILNLLYGYGLEPIKNYNETGSFESKTTNQVMNMFYFPEPLHFIFGAGYWRYPTHNYSLSDVGYMKVLMSYGIFGFIIFYLFQLFIYFKAFRFYSNNFNFKLIFLFVFFIMFLTELKEEFFVQNYAFKMVVFLAVFSFTKKAFFKNVHLK